MRSLNKEIERREWWNLLAPFPVYNTEILNDLKIREEMITKQEDYNRVPITYCKICLGLHIKTANLKDNPDIDYCVDCGTTELETTNIDMWEELYEEKYGEKFINK